MSSDKSPSVVDAHHHLWRYSEEEYGWIGTDMEVIRRSFDGRELREVTEAAGVTSTVAVQARTCEAENDFLLGMAGEFPEIAGVVGWIDLTSPEAGAALDRRLSDPKFKGVREICQGEPDGRFFDNPDFHRGIRELTRRGLPYDLLVFQDQLPAATRFVDAHPDQPMVLDHGGKPEIRDGSPPDEWRRAIRELGRRDHLWCKLSGLVTEVRDGLEASEARMRPYFEELLAAFGPERLMFGSDWPVSLLASEYSAWITKVRGWIDRLSDAEQAAILGGTAGSFYALG
jgi:L-fuconolactonase